MKIISTGTRYEIYNDTLKTYDELPNKVYVIRFNKMSGFYMEEYSDIEIKESKIYGVHKSKVEKVIRTFSLTNKNLGVILSGHKGIGKSLFAKMLSIEAVTSGIPVIIVDRYIPGIASYIEEIEQEVMILFDEFDKTFGGVKQQEGSADPQTEMLTLFDGISQGKKLFVVTCNEIYNLNDYLINRPGRFHYHFRFSYPVQSEVEEYLRDKLDEKYYKEISKVVKFSNKVDLNYDCLRAIAFELNTGETFEESIKDLNILNTHTQEYNAVLYYTTGETLTSRGVSLNMFTEDSRDIIYLYDSKGDNVGDVHINVADCEYDARICGYTVPADKINLEYFIRKEDDNIFKTLQISHLALRRAREKDIHYTV